MSQRLFLLSSGALLLGLGWLGFLVGDQPFANPFLPIEHGESVLVCVLVLGALAAACWLSRDQQRSVVLQVGLLASFFGMLGLRAEGTSPHLAVLMIDTPIESAFLLGVGISALTVILLPTYDWTHLSRHPWMIVRAGIATTGLAGLAYVFQAQFDNRDVLLAMVLTAFGGGILLSSWLAIALIAVALYAGDTALTVRCQCTPGEFYGLHGFVAAVVLYGPTPIAASLGVLVAKLANNVRRHKTIGSTAQTPNQSH